MQTLQPCIQQCWNCRHECQETLFQYCLPTGGAHSDKAHVQMMADCIEICQVAADFMTRGSPLHMVVCAACAEICDACAESCEKLGDSRMQSCAAACRACARSCRDMGKMKKAA